MKFTQEQKEQVVEKLEAAVAEPSLDGKLEILEKLKNTVMNYPGVQNQIQRLEEKLKGENE